MHSPRTHKHTAALLALQMNPEGASSATFNQKAWVAVDTDACFAVCRIDAVDDLITSYSADATGGVTLTLDSGEQMTGVPQDQTWAYSEAHEQDFDDVCEMDDLCEPVRTLLHGRRLDLFVSVCDFMFRCHMSLSLSEHALSPPLPLPHPHTSPHAAN